MQPSSTNASRRTRSRIRNYNQPFSHINIVPVGATPASDENRKPDHSGCTPSSPGLSPRSASHSGASQTTVFMMPLPSDPAVTELAAAKLMRQNQRILEHDPTVLFPQITSKIKSVPRIKGSKTWKPFSLNLPEYSDGCASPTEVSRRASPFDVHAKVFEPHLRDSSGRISSNFLASTTMTTSEPDDNDFRLVTSRKTKPSTRSALGLNAYEVKTEDRPSTVTASSNKKEINEVFGNDLPSPEYVQSICGSQHGQLQFVVHPNGDVSAHQWSIEKYQWMNIGQFSNIRKRREGMLASLRLKDETEEHTMQQNTLVYFRAVAKQLEANIMGLPWGPKEIQAIMPNVRVRRAVSLASREMVIAQSEMFSDIPTADRASSNAFSDALFDSHTDKPSRCLNLLETFPEGVSRDELCHLQHVIDSLAPTGAERDSHRDSIRPQVTLGKLPLPEELEELKASEKSSKAVSSRNDVSFGTFPVILPKELEHKFRLTWLVHQAQSVYMSRHTKNVDQDLENRPIQRGSQQVIPLGASPQTSSTRPLKSTYQGNKTHVTAENASKPACQDGVSVVSPYTPRRPEKGVRSPRSTLKS